MDASQYIHVSRPPLLARRGDRPPTADFELTDAALGDCMCGMKTLVIAIVLMVSSISMGGQAGGRGAATSPPPITWPSPPPSDQPIVMDTAIQRPIRLVPTKGFNQPWSMAFLPDGSILVTERAGRLRIVRNGVLDPTPIAGVPAVAATGLAGLMDIALHPRFNENQFIYLTYHKPAAAGATGGGTITLARGRWVNGAL